MWLSDGYLHAHPLYHLFISVVFFSYPGESYKPRHEPAAATVGQDQI